MTDRMFLSRREVLAGSAALAGAAMLGPVMPFGGAFARVAGVHTAKVGALEVTILSDGVLAVASAMIDRSRPEAEIAAVVKDPAKPAGPLEFSVNVVLVKSGHQRILIDTGAGANWQATAGKLAQRLEAAAIDPASINRVIITHAHPDHIWGAIDEFDDSPRFSKAEHVLPQAERDFWNDVDLSKLPAAAQGVGAGAKRVLKSLGDQLKTVKPEVEIAPGISYIATPGHTPGHCSVRLNAGNETLIVTADAVFHPVSSFAHPEWQPRQDMDGDKAVASRKRLLDMAVADKAAVLSYHIPFPGFGRVEKKDTAYRWVSAS